MNAFVIARDEVHDEDRDAAVVFCASEEDARRVAFERGGAGYDPACADHRESVSVRREPRFDEYAATGRVPASALLAASWCLPCAYAPCGRQVRDDADDLDDGEAVHPNDAVANGEVVWCSTACRDASALRRAWRRALRAHVVTALPHAREVSAWETGDGWAVEWTSPATTGRAVYEVTATGEHYRCDDRDEAVYARDVAALRGTSGACAT